MTSGVMVLNNSNTNKYTFSDMLSPSFMINSTSTMHAVLGFKTEEVDLVVVNVTETILKSTIPIVSGVNITAVNTVFTINYTGAGVNTLMFNMKVT